MPKKKPEFEVTVYRTSIADYLGAGTLQLPFTQDEYHDALQKARAADGGTPVSIELNRVRREALRPHTMDVNDGMLSDTSDLLELNLLARRLDGMDEDALAGFEAMIILEGRKADQPIPVARLINMTYEADGCVQAGNIRTYAELGQFLFENDMLPEKVLDQTLDLTPAGSFGEKAPEEWLTLIGRQHLEANGGVFTKAGYFECPADIPEVYKRGEMSYFDRFAGTVVLEVGNPYAEEHSGEFITLGLPTTDEGLSAKLQQIGAESIEECVWRCTDCLIPDARKWIMQEDDFALTNQFAVFLHDLERRESPERYKALLQAAKCSDLDTAIRLGADLDAHEFSADQATPAHYGKAALYEIYGDEAGDALFPYMDCFKYGKDLMDVENAVITDYGVIRRTDAEPIQTPEDDETEDFEMGGIT
jgi:hypothetical protein